MNMVYPAIGAAWLVITVLLSVYITGWRMKPEQHFKAGFTAMALSYLLGATILFIMVIRSQ